MSVGSVVLFLVSLSFVDCSAGYEVNSIVCVFEGVRINYFVWSSLKYLAGMGELAVWLYLYSCD